MAAEGLQARPILGAGIWYNPFEFWEGCRGEVMAQETD